MNSHIFFYKPSNCIIPEQLYPFGFYHALGKTLQMWPEIGHFALVVVVSGVAS